MGEGFCKDEGSDLWLVHSVFSFENFNRGVEMTYASC